jgi:hypothetical protein
VILAPPLWATGSWVDDSWADGTWATTVSIPTEFGDLTTLYVHYYEALRDANPLRVDTTTLIANDKATVVAGGFSPDDLNTAYARYLS